MTKEDFKIFIKNILNIMLSKKHYIFLLVLIIIGVSVRLNFFLQKEYYHIDEILSYQIIGGKDKIFVSQDDIYNKWHDGAFFKDYWKINEVDFLNLKKVLNKIFQNFRPPLYYWLLHIFTVIIDDGEMNLLGGFILNILFFVLSCVLLFKLSEKILKDKFYSLSVCAIWIFIFASISNSIYMRPYELLTFLNLLTIYVFYKIFNSNNSNKKIYFLFYILVILGLLTNQFYIFILLILLIFGIFSFFIKKDYDKLKKNLYSLIFGVLSVYLIFPVYLDNLTSSNRSVEIVDKISLPFSEKVSHLLNRLSLFNKLFNEKVFYGSLIIFIILILSLIIKLIITKTNFKKILNKMISFKFFIILSSVFWFFVVIYISPYADMRYIVAILPLFILSLICLIEYVFNNYLLKQLLIFSIVLMVLTSLLYFKEKRIDYLYLNDSEIWSNVFHEDESILVFLNPKQEWKINLILPILAKQNNNIIIINNPEDYKKFENIDNSCYIFDNSVKELDFSNKTKMFDYFYFSIYFK